MRFIINQGDAMLLTAVIISSLCLLGIGETHWWLYVAVFATQVIAFYGGKMAKKSDDAKK
jgi:hypothetical protein